MFELIKKMIIIIFVLLTVISCSSTTENKPTVLNPVISPGGNMYSGPKNITITCATVDANIYYTLNGTDPTESSTPYTGSFEITANTTIKARAFLDGHNSSNIVIEKYEIYTIIPKQMILVDGGSFQMGGGTYFNALPAHNVTVNSFLISKYEETQKDWNSIMSNNHFNQNDGIGDNYPAYGINWYQAIYYCNKRSIIEGLTPCYSKNGETDPRNWGSIPLNNYNEEWDSITCNWSANGYRLPTEAEWEFASIGGNSSNGYLYSGSDNCHSVAWYDAGSSQPVGLKQPNELGIYDMSGNVGEPCWDWFADYTSESQSNPTGPSSGLYRVSRGGCWATGLMEMLVKARSIMIFDPEFNFKGIRVVRSVR